MAWRDSRRNRARLFLFTAAVIAGIAAMTAVRTFTVNLSADLDREAKTLLGADLLLEGNQPVSDSLLQTIQRWPGAELARVYTLASMVYFPRQNATRLVMVRAVEGGFPFFGKWRTIPADAQQRYQAEMGVLAEHSLMLQFGVQMGDSVYVGARGYRVSGDLLSRPGGVGAVTMVAPTVYIPFSTLGATDLVQKGSRVSYQYYFRFDPSLDVRQQIRAYEARMESAQVSWQTVDSNKERIGNAFDNFATFLNLAGLVSLLLGCIGVAGAVHTYLKDKLPTVAILRCLGAKGRQAFYVYLVQIAGIGLVGSLVGAVVGSVVQRLLPIIAQDLLPVEQVSTQFSPITFVQAVLTGVLMSVLFALLPLAGILQTSPLRTLRVDYGETQQPVRWLQALVYLLIVGAITGFSRWLIGNWQETWAFMGGLAVAFLLLWVVAVMLIWVVRHFFPRQLPYVWRQGIANLYRPGNQTVLLVVSIGLGTLLLSTLFLVQQLLLRQVGFAGSGSQPNMIMFGIQTEQRDSLAQLVQAHGLPLLQQVPIVTTRVETINGLTKAQAEQDSSLPHRAGWTWDREYRVTFRDTLIDTEEVMEGAWIGHYQRGSGPVPVSISDGLQRGMKASLGDRIVFNVQGARIETVVRSVRKVNFNRVQTNFLVLFPQGVLEQAPQFHVIVSRVPSAQVSAALQTEVVRRYPNVSAIDLTQILESVDGILSKLAFVIRFMASFSILTGLLVLLSAVYQSKYARLRESVLLRTLGASRGQIRRIQVVEYALLGVLACLTGIGLSVGSAWALAHFAFKIPFALNWGPLGLIFLVITSLTVLLGLSNSRDVVRRPPLEVLRSEVI